MALLLPLNGTDRRTVSNRPPEKRQHYQLLDRHQTAFREAFDNLHTPLAVTKGYVQTLLKHWDRLTDEQRRTYADKALNSTGHMVEALSRSEMMLRPLVEAGTNAIDEKKRGLEDSIVSIRGVRAAKVHDAGEDVSRIEVLVVPERVHEEPQVITAVQAAASDLSVEVPPENIRVVTVPVDENGQQRRKLLSVVTRRSDDGFEARVWLEKCGDVLVGEASADHQPGGQYEAVARAILDAVGNLLPGEAKVLHVDLLKIGAVGSATVALDWDGRRLIGTAELQRDQYDAIARAALDALNRFIAPRY
jgi:hypothetical protein